MALALDHAIRVATKSEWRGNTHKETQVRKAIKKVLKEDALVEPIFGIVKTQKGY